MWLKLWPVNLWCIANVQAFTGSQATPRVLGGDGGSLVKRDNASLKQLQKAQTECNQKCVDAIDNHNARLAAEGAATRQLDGKEDNQMKNY